MHGCMCACVPACGAADGGKLGTAAHARRKAACKCERWRTEEAVRVKHIANDLGLDLRHHNHDNMHSNLFVV